MYNALEALDRAARENKIPYLQVVNGEIAIGDGGAIPSLLFTLDEWWGLKLTKPIVEYCDAHAAELIYGAKKWCAEGRSLLYVQTALDKIYKMAGQEPMVLFNIVFSNWMAILNSFIGDKPLTDILVPGTHNSASDMVNDPVFIYPDNRDLGNNIIKNTFIKDMVEGWVLTQNKTVLAQLNSGIRFIDLNIAYDADTNEVYCMNLMVNHTLQDVLTQIQYYIAAHPYELVYVNITLNDAQLELTKANARPIADTIRYELGSYIAKKPDLNRTLNEYIKNKENLVLLIENESQRLMDEQYLCDSLNLHLALPYSFRTELLENLQDKDDVIHTVFAVEPNVGTGILYMMSGENLEDVAKETNRYVAGFVDNYAEANRDMISIDLDYPAWPEIEKIIHYNLS